MVGELEFGHGHQLRQVDSEVRLVQDRRGHIEPNGGDHQEACAPLSTSRHLFLAQRPQLHTHALREQEALLLVHGTRTVVRVHASRPLDSIHVHQVSIYLLGFLLFMERLTIGD